MSLTAEDKRFIKDMKSSIARIKRQNPNASASEILKKVENHMRANRHKYKRK